MTYKDTILKLFELQKFGMKFGLDSMQLILKKLSNPERGGTFVHVAGTNGKGSTLAFLASILRLSGYKTGLYTSPHLVSFRERIQLDGVLLSEEDVIELASIIWKATDPEHPPTFFEFVTAMAFVYFKEKG
ncbi:MAG: bifunctional folylpolyglutamate synthase/dihydrofolate synthase, partial [Deltaproteobacteria bacterium]|nr:bifunctional folylpolyglutamate synthase/dihydrofolate synthase [Deltaproteobacteria bacterium]